jgi:hypothetical protein
LVWWTAEQRMGREHGGLTGMALDVFTAPGEFPLSLSLLEHVVPFPIRPSDWDWEVTGGIFWYGR